MEDNAAPQQSLITRYARPALIAGVVVAVVCIALLIIIFALDSFNSAAYSVTGKSVNDATEEAREIRETYSGARLGGTIALVVSGVVALAAAVLLYRNRRSARMEDGDDGEDLGLEDLRGQ
ncbi:hypothetical protein [Paenarthrobacter ilicis]|uniref:ABC-type Fe3+ transport system permease subunit n=1 Tax=Paenarthrobacter ilicis TaxID=43665 RepID=A0ABX0TC80_9MICC|nr:hypothetical protein [Paenarthrobacter ilicis]MBM7793939.1 ABC-type Fe3+ transport system permease subunit [Paenarthrobacter ilicis]NIJ00119.1 ABC-type Fe3+ transport system permease subunit [Paenarthrobacter ilicis]